MVPKFIRALLKADQKEQNAFYARQIPLGVFKTHKDEVRWIFKYREEYGRFPSVGRFRRRFKSTPLPKSKDTFTELVQEVVDYDILEQLTKSVENSRNLYASGSKNVREVVSSLRDQISDIELFDSSYTDVNFSDRGLIKRNYLQRARFFQDNPIALEPTPWKTANQLISLIDSGELLTIASRTSIGKAQPLSSTVLTPDGFMPMGSIKRGSLVVGANGSVQKVIEVFPQGKLKVFKVLFNDGTFARCCDDHLWSVANHDRKKVGDYSFSTVDLRTIRRRLKSGNRFLWQVPHFLGDHSAPTKILPIHPWLLGALLGDGCLKRDLTITKKDKELFSRVRALLPSSDKLVKVESDKRGYTYRIVKKVFDRSRCYTEGIIQELGLRGKRSFERVIPQKYLNASFEQRLQLLQGLMDTDGHVTASGSCFEQYTSSPRMARQVLFLVRSLGCFAKQFKKYGSYVKNGVRRETRVCYVTRFNSNSGVIPVTLNRHVRKLRPPKKVYGKMIVSVVEDGFESCQCIKVSNSDSLYVTDGYTITHNTWVTLYWVRHQLQQKERVLYITKEMPSQQVTDRMTALRFKLPYTEFRTGNLSPKNLARFVKALRKKSSSDDQLFVSGHETLKGVGFAQIVSKVQQYSPTVLWIDGAYLLKPEGLGKHANMAETIQAISSMTKRIAKHFNIKAFITIQAKRETENKEGEADSKLKDLFGGDAWAQDSDNVFIVNGRRGSSTRRILIAKCRDGNVGEFNTMFQINPFPDFKQAGIGTTSNSDQAPMGFTAL